MKILWLINIPLPEASSLMNENVSPFGGWLVNASQDLAKKEEVELSIAFPKSNINGYEILKGENITYYAFKIVRDNDKELIKNNMILKDIVNEVNPDFVHIFGTELAHTLSMVNVCKEKNIETVISIQGLVSVIQKHIFANLPLRVVYGATLRNLLRKDNVIGLKKLFSKRGKNEIEAIKNTNHIIGRTTWDKACTSHINPNAKYHFCNETLREEFYKKQWDIEKCDKHSIFLSQGQYPIKGLHYVIEAMPIILNRYPNAKVYVSGKDITKSDTIKDKLLITYYGKYIKDIIKRFDLDEKIIFTGPLDEKQMCSRFLKSHVFVSPSTIENESNSLSEAKILGVPSVGSYVGGVIDRINHGDDGFTYQHDAPYMLAYYVCEIFENKDLALKFSKRARKQAMKIHDMEVNTNKLIEIYKKIIDS